MDRQERLLEIFFRCLRGEEISVQKLAQEYGVSPKSISRNLNDLKAFLAEHRELVGSTELEYSYQNKCYRLHMDEFLTNQEMFALVEVMIGARAFSKMELLTLISKLKRFTTAEDRKKLEQIISKVAGAIKKPVTVKIRKGFDDAHVNAVEIARIAEGSGAAAIAVHGRTREQYYSGKADWDIIRQVKEAVSIPVIGNGDVDSPRKARAMLEETGCDGVMVGRAARGNPWIFRQIREYLINGREEPKPSLEEVRSMMLRHARMQVEYKGDYTGIREMRKHVSWYTAGLPHSARLRARINSVESLKELEEILTIGFC